MVVRPDIEGILGASIYRGHADINALCAYALHLEKLLADTRLGAEVDDERTTEGAYEIKELPAEYGDPNVPNSPAENPV